jgi:hypothetical protein
MAKNIFSALMAIVALSLACVFTGCASTNAQPMTHKLEQWAEGAGNIKDFQYYISRNIILTKTSDPVITNKVAVTGQIDTATTKNIVQIASSTGGELLKTEIDPDTGFMVYYVAFERENDNCLRFKQWGPGDEEKIYLVYDNVEVYDDVATYAINYGGVVYVIDWGSGSGLQARVDDLAGKVKGKVQGVSGDNADHPYLMVKMEETVTERENYRKASGRKVGE